MDCLETDKETSVTDSSGKEELSRRWRGQHSMAPVEILGCPTIFNFCGNFPVTDPGIW